MTANTTPTYNRRRAKRRAIRKLGAAEKRPHAGHNVSHAQNKTKRVFKPNLQRAKVLIDGKLVSVRLDTRTMRSMTKAIKDRPQRPPAKRPTKKAAPTPGPKK